MCKIGGLGADIREVLEAIGSTYGGIVIVWGVETDAEP